MARAAILAAVPVGQVQSWALARLNALTRSEALEAIERDIPYLPTYRRNLENLWGTIDRAARAGWDSEQVKVARSLMERANTHLQRLSEMVRVAIEKAKAGGQLDRAYPVQLGDWGVGKVIVVGLSTAAVLAALIVAPAWLAAAAVLVGAIVALTHLVNAASRFLASAGPIAPAVVEVAHSAVWIVALAAVAGVWLLSRRKRRVST